MDVFLSPLLTAVSMTKACYKHPPPPSLSFSFSLAALDVYFIHPPTPSQLHSQAKTNKVWGMCMRKAICSTAAFELPWRSARAHSPGQQDMKLHLMRFPNLFCPTVSSYIGPNDYTPKIIQLYFCSSYRFWSKTALSQETDFVWTSKRINLLANEFLKHTLFDKSNFSNTISSFYYNVEKKTVLID